MAGLIADLAKIASGAGSASRCSVLGHPVEQEELLIKLPATE